MNTNLYTFSLFIIIHPTTHGLQWSCAVHSKI